MSTTTGPGRNFFDNHIQHLQTRDIGIIQTDADDDIIVYNNFDLNYLGQPAPNIIRGRVDFAKFFETLFDWQGELTGYELHSFTETEDTILFSATTSFAKTGQWAAGNVFVMNNNFSKIKQQFMYAHKLWIDFKHLIDRRHSY